MKRFFLLALLVIISIVPCLAAIEDTKSFPIGASVGTFHKVEVTGNTSSEKPLDLNSNEIKDMQIGEIVGYWNIYSNYNPLTVEIKAADLTNNMGSLIPYLLKFSYNYAIYENGNFKEDADGVFYVASDTCENTGSVKVEENNRFSFKAEYQPQGISSANQEIRLIVPEGNITDETEIGSYSATVTITIIGGN